MVRSRCFNSDWVLLIVCMATTAGCSSSQPSADELVKTNLRTIAKAYWAISDYHHRPPRDLDELRMALTDLHAVDMSDPPDIVLSSPRDQQLFVIIIGAIPSAEETNTIMAYEKQGAGHTRFVLTTAGKVLELSNDEFAKAAFAENHKPTLGL